MQTQEYSLPEGFEDPGLGGAKYENLSLKPDTDAIYRILPAMKSLRGKNERLPTQFWYTHFWKGRNPKDPTKTKSIPILCIQEKDFKNGGGMITKQCPLCIKREEVKNKIKILEGKLAEKKATPEQSKKVLGPHNMWLKEHGHDGKYRVYVLDESGKLAVLRLTSTCVKLLREAIQKAQTAGYDPISGKAGIWCQFSRRGTGFQTTDTVQFLFDRPPHVLDANLAKTALETLPDFNEEQNRIRYSEDKLEALAALQDDSPDEVNRILGIGIEPAADEFTLEDASELVPEPVPSEGVDEIAAMEATLAAAKAKAAAALAAAKTKKFTPPQKPAEPKAAVFNTEAATEEDLDASFD